MLNVNGELFEMPPAYIALTHSIEMNVIVTAIPYLWL